MIGKLTVALAAVALVAHAVLAQDTTTVAPKGPPPRLITVRSVDGAKGEVIFDVQVVSPDHRDKFVRQPLIGDRFIGEPLIGDKFIGEPLIGDKFIGEPLIGDKFIEGQLGEFRMTLGTKQRYVRLGYKVSVKKVKWAGVDGKEVTAAAVAKKLKPGMTVLLSPDGRAVDAAYLRMFKEDTLVLIVPAEEAPVPYLPRGAVEAPPKSDLPKGDGGDTPQP
jgi:hypothetical protein